ncbi:MAG: hypothetical protein ACI9CD_000735 [Candidatus Deianiraeaceae bacterium]|jgi:hypothetical protein
MKLCVQVIYQVLLPIVLSVLASIITVKYQYNLEKQKAFYKSFLSEISSYYDIFGTMSTLQYRSIISDADINAFDEDVSKTFKKINI